MIIKNIHETQSIGVTTIDNEVIYLRPGQKIEVLDAMGKGYLANYPQFFKKYEARKSSEDVEKDNIINELNAKIKNLTELVDSLIKEKNLEKGKLEGIDKINKEIFDGIRGEDTSEILSKKEIQEEKKRLIIELRKLGVDGVGMHRGLETLENKFNELNKD